MRIIIYPHDLEIGGSQINAIDMAAELARRNHEVAIYGQPGKLNEKIKQLGLEFIESPDPRRRPSLTVAQDLRLIAKTRGVDYIHGFEWPPILEAMIACAGWGRTVAVGTVMSMSVAPFIPKTVPLTVGTEQIAFTERNRRRHAVGLIEPSVDVKQNSCDSSGIDAAQFRRDWRIAQNEILLVCVTRLAHQLKLEGIRSAIEAVERIATTRPLRLAIVGDGPAESVVRQLADTANRRIGSDAVILTGAMGDPRPAYAGADIALGMGGSALRAMAWSKPLIVQGERGYFKLLTPDTLPEFHWQGWYGAGTSASVGTEELIAILTRICDDLPLRNSLATLGREIVEERYSVEKVVDRLELFYAAIADAGPNAVEKVGSAAAGSARFVSHYARRKVRKLLGLGGGADDFNSNPVAARSDATPRQRSRPSENSLSSNGLIYLSGAPWDAVSGTDRQLVEQLGKTRPVLWVDPPVSIISRFRRQITTPSVSKVSDGVTRIHTTTLPGVSRPGIRRLASIQSRLRVERHLRKTSRVGYTSVIASSPEPVLPAWRAKGRHLTYFATDDFVEGAAILGYSTRYVADSRRKNLSSADLVVAVSERLAERLTVFNENTIVIENGCDPQLYADIGNVTVAPEITLAPPIVGLVGQLNDRLDLTCLEAVAEAGANMLLVGPRYEQDKFTRNRLDALIAMDNVQWVGRQPRERLPEFMKAMSVGITPYRNDPFNRMSFPLKTLEYLAAGLSVVSAGLPATRGLRSESVVFASTAEEFANSVMLRAAIPATPDAIAERRELADKFSWSSRAALWGTVL